MSDDNNRARSTKAQCPGHYVAYAYDEVSDTHKARSRAGSPGHRAGKRVELSSSLGVVSSKGC